MGRHIAVSKFKAEVLGILEEISHTDEEIVVTKRGQPLARVRSARERWPLNGSIEYLVDDEDLIAPIPQTWDAARE